MVVLEDTRQQAGKHKNIETYLQVRGIKMVRQQLYVGDYALADSQGVCVDTKQDVRQLAMDIYQDHDRFARECKRAQQAGIRLIVLIEENLPGGRLENWLPPQGCRVNPVQLRKAMITMVHKYGVRFEFCDGRTTGKRLVQILTTGGRW